MLTRFHKILLGLLAVQLALAVFTTTRGGHATPARERPLLAGYDAGKVDRLQVFAAGAGAPLELVKRDGNWVVASSYGYPADASKVADALSAIGRMAGGEPIATKAGRHRQLRVDDAEFERKLVVGAGGKDTTIYLGGAAGPRRTATRLGDSPKVYAVAGISTYSYGSEPRAWIDPSYVKVAKADVARVLIQRGPSRLELTSSAPPPAPPPAADGSAPPSPAPPSLTWAASLDGAAVAPTGGETLDTAAIDRLVDHATTIELTAPADPARAAPTPTATITIERKPSGAATPAPTILDLVADGDSYWVHERGTARAAMVGKDRVDELVTATRATLIKAPPAPAAPPAAPAAPTPPAKPATAKNHAPT